MSTPNFFSFASGESWQDTFICWLVACAIKAPDPLHECGLAFVRALFRAGTSGGTKDIPVLDSDGNPMAPYNGPCEVSDVCTPVRQYGKEKIDVYFQAKVDGKIVSFPIEDKINTQYHSNQLKRSLDYVINDDQDEDLIKPVYFKTGYVFSNEREAVEEDKYSVFEAEDMKNFLDSHPDAIREDQFLRQYSEYLNDKIEARAEALANWDLNQDYVQWEFMQKLRNDLRGAVGKWKHFVPNALSNFQHRWGDRLWRGTSRGRPFSQYWFSEHLFWRFDAWRPLRLMIDLEDAGESYNEIQERYRDFFVEALNQEGLCAGNARIVRKGNERTIGSIDTANLQGMTVCEFLDRVTRVHIRFLELLSA